MRNTGFTLVEMMVTVAVLSILAGIGVPGMSQLIAQSRVTAAANDLQLALQHARSAAATQRKTVTVCAIAAQKCAEETEDWSPGWQTREDSETGPLVREHSLDGVTVTGTVPSFTYTSLGYLKVAAPQQLTFSANNEQAQRWLCVSPQGKATVKREPCA